MDKRRYFPPEAEALEFWTEVNFLISNQSFQEEDDDIFGDDED